LPSPQAHKVAFRFTVCQFVTFWKTRSWRHPNTGEWERTFAIITVPSNELVGQIHNRMPAILEPGSYERWLGLETDPHDLLITYPSEPMTMWPISTRVNAPENDDPSLLDRTGDPFDVWAPLTIGGQSVNK
jgi:putative SOS response-associated peptidase YedK